MRTKPRLIRCPREGCPGNEGWYTQIREGNGPKQCPYCKQYLPGFKRVRAKTEELKGGKDNERKAENE